MAQQTEGRYKVEVKTPGDVNWASNALRFDTVEAAEEYARDLAGRWLAVSEWQVTDTEEVK